MGGTIQLVVRKKDGEVTSLPVWTNSMSLKLLKNPEFLAGDFTAFNEFTDYHQKLVDDYAENKVTQKFKDSGASLYGSIPFGGLYPLSYGIVIFDFKEMKIFEMQEYTSSESIYASFETTLFKSDVRMVSIGSGGDLVNVERLLNGGHIKSVRTDYASDINYDVSHIRSLNELNAFVGERLVHSGELRKYRYGLSDKESFSLDLVFDKKGFETILYEGHNRVSVDKLLMDIQAAGFDLSSHDKEQWNLHVKKYE
jgi:hypothetical protein